MDEGYDEGFDQDVSDVSEFDSGSLDMGDSCDDVGLWMDEVPDVGEPIFDEIQESPEEVDIGSLMDEADSEPLEDFDLEEPEADFVEPEVTSEKVEFTDEIYDSEEVSESEEIPEDIEITDTTAELEEETSEPEEVPEDTEFTDTAAELEEEISEPEEVPADTEFTDTAAELEEETPELEEVPADTEFTDTVAESEEETSEPEEVPEDEEFTDTVAELEEETPGLEEVMEDTELTDTAAELEEETPEPEEVSEDTEFTDIASELEEETPESEEVPEDEEFTDTVAELEEETPEPEEVPQDEEFTDTAAELEEEISEPEEVSEDAEFTDTAAELEEETSEPEEVSENAEFTDTAAELDEEIPEPEEVSEDTEFTDIASELEEETPESEEVPEDTEFMDTAEPEAETDGIENLEMPDMESLLPGEQEQLEAWMEGKDPAEALSEFLEKDPSEEIAQPSDNISNLPVPVELPLMPVPVDTSSTEEETDDAAETDSVPISDTENTEAIEKIPINTPGGPNDPGNPNGPNGPGGPGGPPTWPPNGPNNSGNFGGGPNMGGGNLSALDRMTAYLSQHNYGREDFATYCRDPEWQRLNNQLLMEQEVPPSAADQLHLYMCEHNYGREDYSIYSRDPEWQRLNEATQENPDLPVPVTPYDQRIDAVSIETTSPQMQEIEESIPATDEKMPVIDATAPIAPDIEEEIPEVDSFYEQGNNEYGFENTCGPTSIANSLNYLLGKNEYTENAVLTQAIQEGLCANYPDCPSAGGGTTTDEFIALYEHMNERSGDQLQIDRFDFDKVLTMDEVVQKLDEGSVVNVAVDADTLWGERAPSIMGAPAVEKNTDHWITVTGVDRSEDGKVQGFHIIDSGGGVSYVDTETYQAMCYGDDSLHLKDPTCIVVSQKDLSPLEEGNTETSLPSEEIQPQSQLEPLELKPPGVEQSVPELRESSDFFSTMDTAQLQSNQASLERMSDEERRVYLDAVQAEPSITQDVASITQAAGGQNAGLEYRIKTPNSLIEKLHDREIQTDIHDVNDILRYTEIYSPQQLVQGTNESLAQFEEKGYLVREIKNTWEDPNNPYNGINVKLLSPSGQKLELQFHTQESFELKNGPMHELYEQWRCLPEDSKEAIELQNKMFALSRQLQVPSKIGEVRRK